MSSSAILWFDKVGIADVPDVGGKNASLGEMVCELAGAGVRVPEGFATTAAAFRNFVEANRLADGIRSELGRYHDGKISLAEAGAAIRARFLESEFPPETAEAIRAAYRELCARAGRPNLDVAVRSSATAEDLPDASFAGQQETLLNIRGERALLDACRRCYASLAGEFAREFDGFSIGSNDLTQLVLGVDRDSDILASLFDERDAAVKTMIAEAIHKAHNAGIKVGICGQGPSNHPEFAAFLVERGIESISLNPDSFILAMRHVAAAEEQLPRPVRNAHPVAAGQPAEAAGAEPHSFEPVRDGCR